MALTDAALTDLATVLDELGLTSDSGGAQDTRLERYIEAASAAVAKYCNRTFERSDAVVEKVAGTGRTRIRVERIPLLSITSITDDGDIITASDYEIESVGAGLIFNESGWVWDANNYHWITKDPIPGDDDKNLTVTYSGGYVTRPQAEVGGTFAGETVTVPLDLEDAVVQMVTTRWYKKGDRVDIKSEGLLGGNVTYRDGGWISEEIAAVLEQYRTIVGC